jgi:hypothetical protein
MGEADVEANIDTRIRTLCKRLADEQDPAEITRLAGTLRTLVDTEQDEARLRLRYIVHRYRDRVRALASRSATERSAQLHAVIAFLGIGTRMNGGGEIQN